jgi:hypothetical protein
VEGYSYSLDHHPLTVPEAAIVRESESAEYRSLSDGVWYFHCRARNGTGLWGPASHYEIRIDTEPPEISITYPQSDVWYREPITEYSGTVNDHASGVDLSSFQYSYYGQASDDEGWTLFHSDTIEEGVLWSDYSEIPHVGETSGSYLRIKVRDRVGNLAISDPVVIKVDLSISPPTIISPTHPDQGKWYTNNSPAFSWSSADDYSGPDTYSWGIDHSASTNPPQIGMTNATSTTDIKGLSDGIWYFHVRARDRAGNWSESAHYMVKIDSISPKASVEISGDVVTHGNPPLVRPGRVEVLLRLSEPAYSPVLKYRPAGAGDPIPVELIAGSVNTPSTEWRGVLDITGQTGDGRAVFSFSAQDAAQNTGSEITTGGSFMIDSIPPTVTLEIMGPAVEQRTKPLVRSGPVEILVQTSESVFDPMLQYLPASAATPIPVELIGSQDKWIGHVDVTIRTGDGEAAFEFSARDAAGNMGSEIVTGDSFEIDTLIRGDADEALDVLCVAEPKTRITIPPGAFSQDVRIEIIKNPAHLQAGMTAMYDFIACDPEMKEVRGLVFSTPVKMTFFPESQPHFEGGFPSIGVHFWDGVGWQKVQDDWTSVEVDHLGRFVLMESESMTAGIMHGWAAPNPFTPNGSGDATDRTIFHVAAKDRLIDFAVRIYDINGRLVKSLEAGRRAWDGTDEDGRIVEGGLYIYQINSGEQTISGTVVVLK